MTLSYRENSCLIETKIINCVMEHSRLIYSSSQQIKKIVNFIIIDKRGIGKSFMAFTLVH